MNRYFRRLLLILLLVAAVFATGCIDNGFLKQFEGKQVGVYVYSDTEFPSIGSKQPISNQIITSKLANYINHWSKINATAIFPSTPEIDIQAEFAGTGSFSEAGLDYLLVIKILEIQSQVRPSIHEGLKMYYGYDTLLEYQLFERDAPEPILSGNGMAEARDKVLDSSNFSIHIPDSEDLVTDAIISFLRRQRNLY